jgi:hypothetical protein
MDDERFDGMCVPLNSPARRRAPMPGHRRWLWPMRRLLVLAVLSEAASSASDVPLPRSHHPRIISAVRRSRGARHRARRPTPLTAAHPRAAGT